MSLNKIAASKPNRRTGWSVTSAASSGVWTSSRKECSSLSLRYSGRARPAWRMSQTGGRSTGWRAQALRNRWRPVKLVVASRVASVIAAVMGIILTSPSGFEQQLAPDFSCNFVLASVFNLQVTMKNEPQELRELLSRLPDAPVPSNFTARVMRAAELDDLQAARRRGWHWN